MFKKIMMLILFAVSAKAQDITVEEIRNRYIEDELVVCNFRNVKECELKGELGEDLKFRLLSGQTPKIDRATNLKVEAQKTKQDIFWEEVISPGIYDKRSCISHRINCRYTHKEANYEDLLNWLSEKQVARYQLERVEQEKVLKSPKQKLLKVIENSKEFKELVIELNKVKQDVTYPLGNKLIHSLLTREEYWREYYQKTLPEDELVECVNPKKLKECEVSNPLEWGEKNFNFDLAQMLPYGFDSEKWLDNNQCGHSFGRWNSVKISADWKTEGTVDSCISSKVNCKGKIKILTRDRWISSSWSSAGIAELELRQESIRDFLKNKNQLGVIWVDKKMKKFKDLDSEICKQKKKMFPDE